MIIRAVLTFGLVWLLMPHHPDLGLQGRATEPSDSTRAAIFERLRDVRHEIEAPGRGQVNLVRDHGREAALQKAGRLPDKAAPDGIAADVLRAVKGLTS
jgi:hypothetical protein